MNCGNQTRGIRNANFSVSYVLLVSFVVGKTQAITNFTMQAIENSGIRLARRNIEEFKLLLRKVAQRHDPSSRHIARKRLLETFTRHDKMLA